MKTNEAIKQARKAAKMTQAELASNLKVNRATVSKYETGEIEPSVKMIEAIARILTVTPDYLLGYSDAPNIRKATQVDINKFFGDRDDICTIEVTKSDSRMLYLYQQLSVADREFVCKTVEHLSGKKIDDDKTI